MVREEIILDMSMCIKRGEMLYFKKDMRKLDNCWGCLLGIFELLLVVYNFFIGWGFLECK